MNINLLYEINNLNLFFICIFHLFLYFPIVKSSCISSQYLIENKSISLDCNQYHNYIQRKNITSIYFKNKEILNKNNIGVSVDDSGNILFEASMDKHNKRYYYGIKQNGRGNFTNENNEEIYEKDILVSEKYIINKKNFSFSNFYNNEGGKYYISFCPDERYIEIEVLVGEDENEEKIKNIKLYDLIKNDTYGQNIILLLNEYSATSSFFNSLNNYGMFYIIDFIGKNPSNDKNLYFFLILYFQSRNLKSKAVESIFSINLEEIHNFLRTSYCIAEINGSALFIFLYLDINSYLRVRVMNFLRIYNQPDISLGYSNFDKYFICLNLDNSKIIFIYFAENNKKINFSLKTLITIDKENKTFIDNFNIMTNKEEKYPISSLYLNNEAIVINSKKIIIISKYENNNGLLIQIIELFNKIEDEYKSINIRYYEFSLIDNKIEIINRFYIFLFKGLIGLYFYNNKNSYPSFILFCYANSEDPEQIDDLINKMDNYTIIFKNYINIENNIFGYEIKGIKVISIPNSEDSGIYLYSSNYKQI